LGEVAGPAADRGPRLVGREHERARIGAFIAALPHGTRTLSIVGEPGIGKTALWRLAVDDCLRAGFGVVVARPAEEDMPLALAGLVDLFERTGVDADALLAEDNAFARGRAVLAALRELTAERPAVVAIDDVQWLDPPSARALRYALRRLDAEPVGVLATQRSTPTGEDPLAAADALPAGRAEALELAPLCVEELRRVLATTVDAISRPALNHIHAVSGGNPLFGLELARGLASSGGGLRLPRSLQAAIAGRIDTVSPELAALLEIVAATGPTSVSELRVTVREADALLPEAVRQELLVVDDDLGVRFAHPLIGSVVYDRLCPLARRELHARLAASAADADVRARHLARSTDEPCPRIAQLLEDAAERAAARGAFDLAAEFAGHSVRLTPRADVDAALRRGMIEIDHVATAGEVGRALRLADALVAVMPAGPARAEALLRRAYLEDDDPEISVSIVRDAVEYSAGDELLRARALNQLGWTLGVFGGDLPAGIAYAREAAAIVERADDRVLARASTPSSPTSSRSAAGRAPS
jgi:AAA ATPase domain